MYLIANDDHIDRSGDFGQTVFGHENGHFGVNGWD